MLINSLCTNCILKKDNWKFLTYLTAFYGLFLWLIQVTTGNQQYDFLNMESGEGFKILFGINLASVAIYIVFCMLDESIKPINESNSNIYTYGEIDKRNKV